MVQFGTPVLTKVDSAANSCLLTTGWLITRLESLTVTGGASIFLLVGIVTICWRFFFCGSLTWF